MSQLTPTKNDTLLCVYKDCKTPQGDGGEYCDKHYVALYGGHFCKEHGYIGKDEIDPCDIPF